MEEKTAPYAKHEKFKISGSKYFAYCAMLYFTQPISITNLLSLGDCLQNILLAEDGGGVFFKS